MAERERSRPVFHDILCRAASNSACTTLSKAYTSLLICFNGTNLRWVQRTTNEGIVLGMLVFLASHKMSRKNNQGSSLKSELDML